MNHPEHDLQVAALKWFALQYPKYADIIYAIPNERKASIIQGARFKAQGVKSGVPDLCLPVAKNLYHGLYIEMKSKKGVVSEQQTKFQYLLSNQGYCVEVCRSIDQFMTIINEYLSH